MKTQDIQKQDRSITIGNYVFDEKNHIHTLDGKPLHGVTTILKVIGKGDVLVQWSANKAVEYIEKRVVIGHYNVATQTGSIEFDGAFDDILNKAKTAWKDNRDKAGEKGTEIHGWVEVLINKAINENGGYIKDEGILNKQVNHFVQWAIENNVKFLKAEQSLYSRTYWYGGIADIICEIDGIRFVGDVKTSSGIYPEHFIQTSAYAKALIEMGEYDKFGGVVILNLKKNGGFDYRYNYDIEGNFECFKACLIIKKQLDAITK
jgi:genome maintenance exonuclease 1